MMWINRLVQLRNTGDYIIAFVMLITLAGVLNHLRDLILTGAQHRSFFVNLSSAAFTAIPLGVLFLWVLGRMAGLQRDLQTQASTDQLTGLPNRRYFTAKVQAMLDDGRDGSFLMIDADHFKRMNDLHGHAVGDKALIQIAQFLRDRIDGMGPVARMGGEEFAVFLPGVIGADALALGGKLAAGVRVCVNGQTKVEYQTLSVGISTAKPPSQLPILMHQADQALYDAKSRGRACAVCFESDLIARAVEPAENARLRAAG